MGLLLHPNKEDPKRYRVWDKELKIQKYYPLTPAGKKLANKHIKQINAEKKRLAAERKTDIYLLFTGDGLVKGMKRKVRTRANRAPYECFSLYAKKQQTEIVIGDKFNASYRKAFDWLLSKHKLEMTPEVKKRFNKARKFYKE